MAGFGELVLVMGDCHVPYRASVVPEKFKRMLVPNKMQHVVCTGNIDAEQYDELRALAPNVHVVAGDFDIHTSFPETSVLQVGQFRIGVVHGHQILPPHSQHALARMRRKLNVDILVYGHSHQNQVTCHDGYYHINPGSMTGAHSVVVAPHNVSPSFILLAVKENTAVCYVYEYNNKNGQVDVSKTDFTKKTVEPGM
ncbi:protein sorting-associated protein 29 [Seminavis robusta]|uniref:Vacuolar protein sorting-associated protein 29 n=1 Tax=Seminavis robusta TaxID=568900 RepID=A0A9N8DQV7_9STRA|nr:protein sorting-associated protein 29 [Seminavis robusta]|eukprot:Sro191_g082350.1 protein sorting-associated protein 29 (197) ;mRNA; f:77767-78474